MRRASLLLLFLCLPATVSATDLVVTKEADKQTVAVGDTVRYTITVRNDKISFAIPTGVELFDRFTAGLQWIGIEGDFSLSDCQALSTNDGFDCTFDIDAQEVKTAVATFVVTAAGQQVNAVSVNTTVGEIDPSDNEAEASVTVELPGGGLTITKRGISLAGGSDIVGGLPYAYAITVTAAQPGTYENLTVTDALPSQVGFDGDIKTESRSSSDTEGVPCFVDILALTVECPPFSLLFGETRTIEISSHVRPPALDPNVCNTAILKQDGEQIGQATTCAPIIRRFVLRQEAAMKAKEQVAQDCASGAAPCIAPIQTLSDEPLEPGTQVCDVNGENCTVLEEPMWISTRDYDPYALYDHILYYDLIPAGSEETDTPEAITTIASDLPYVILEENGTTTETSTEELPLISDPLPEPAEFPTLEIDNSTPPAKPRVCALLVTGYAQSANETVNFRATRSVMQQYLTTARRGPKLPTANVEVLENPTQAELEQKLTSLKGKCDEFYFYYFGHGNKTGLFLRTASGRAKFKAMTYADVAKGIYGVEAKENTVVLDNCNSGAAVPKFKADPSFKTTNLTLLTGASADNLAYRPFKTNQPGILVSFYTGGLAICANDARADADGKNGVSLKESHHWLRRVNPKLLKFTNQQGGIDVFGINEKQDPQLLENRVQQNDGTKTSFNFEDSGVLVTTGTGKHSGTEAIDAVRVEEISPRSGTLPQDNDLMELAAGRHRTVEILESGTTGFDIDITFSMDAALDSVTTTGLPGLAFRADDTDPWMQRVATVWNPADSTVTVTGITTSGDWAFALTSGASAVAVEAMGIPRAFTLHGNYPNPFNPATTLRFDLPEAAEVRVEVFDLLGRGVLALAPGQVAAGLDRTLTIDASTLTSGMYLYRLTAHSATHTHTATGRFVLLK